MSNSAAPSTTNASPDVEAKKVNRPSDSRLKQQKLKAWQPILTAGTVLPTFFVIGLIFIPIGAVLLVASNNVFEKVYDYTMCEQVDEGNNPTNNSCKDFVQHNPGKTCTCQIEIELEETITADKIFVYYGLSNFYQNHRRYVKSRDDKQLLGVDITSPAQECTPFQKTANGTPIAPCGAIANSMFNDSFTLIFKQNGQIVPLDRTGIAWPSDRAAKFANPSNAADWDKIEKPPNWAVKPNELSTDPDENGFKNESFIVWMRLSALPTFRKLHSRINKSGSFQNGLTQGKYNVRIDYRYPVFEFDGKKRFIISTTSWAGGKNPFLGVAYIVVGCLCILTGLIFFFIHLKFGKSLTEMANIGR